MNIDRFIELEERRLSEDYENGEINGKEYNRELRELYREAQGALEEEAQQVYNDVMSGYR